MNVSAKLVNSLGHLPVARMALRWYAHRYKEGSEVCIARGYAAGLWWRRHHRYVNGYWTGIYELSLQEAFAREIKEGETVYDIGANAGFFTVLAAKLVGPTGRVVSFEPLPENIDSIREQITINSLNHCELITKAVSDRSGKVSFTPTDNNSTAHISKENGEKTRGGENGLTVETITLDEFILDYPPPDFVKIDVEGAETDVLAGANALLNLPRPPKFLIELHGEDKARRVRSTLVSYGYRLFSLSGARLVDGVNGQHHILAYPPASLKTNWS